jgi:hypothetical protein
MKKSLPLLVSMSLVLGLNLFGVRASGAGTSMPTRSSASLTLPQRAVSFVPRFINGANRKLRYTIKAKYPQAAGAQRDPRLLKMNQELRALINKDVASFKDDFQAPEERMGVGSSYDAGYQVTLATANLVSISFGVSTYYEGAAHGNHHTIPFNYDLAAGRSLALKDLFKPGSNYLKLISDYAIAHLKKKFAPDADEEWIQKGAGANEENYRSWNITRRSLVVTFDPYQVVYYAAGPQEITIPYSVLRNAVDPAGPLAALIK